MLVPWQKFFPSLISRTMLSTAKLRLVITEFKDCALRLASTILRTAPIEITITIMIMLDATISSIKVKPFLAFSLYLMAFGFFLVLDSFFIFLYSSLTNIHLGY